MKTIFSSVGLAIAAGGLALTGLCANAPAFAAERPQTGDVRIAQRDQDEREERGRGRDEARPYVPLESIIGQIQARTPGRLVGVRGPNGQGIYRIVWETPDGRVITFVVDGRTGQVLR